MIDPELWATLEKDFSPLQLYEIREILEEAKNLGGRRIDIVPQTLFEHEHCHICASFYSREVAELWLARVGRSGTGPHRGRIKDGYRMCIEFPVYTENPFWPGW